MEETDRERKVTKMRNRESGIKFREREWERGEERERGR